MTVMSIRRTFIAEEYQRMGQAGILHEDDPVELIEGEIVQMAAIGARHSACVKNLTRFFYRYDDQRFVVGVHDPVRLNDASEPEPDLSILRYREDNYSGGHPTSQDVLLLIEVADSSLEYDRQVKAPLYARTGIPEYWLVNLTSNTVNVFTDPQNGVYHSEIKVERGDISPKSLPDLKLDANAILP